MKIGTIGAAGSGSLSEAAEFGDVVLFGVKKDAVESALEAARARAACPARSSSTAAMP
ncbi:hypothetical protein ABIA39_000980 [Nocardia sp. GAS34]|jgi:hypothetical protein|uniref:hypothetical protein n=1 Tax=unclassified Nocardia TaxID=2637762 RepID=UPI003D2056E8